MEGAILDSMFSKGLKTFVVNNVPIPKAPGSILWKILLLSFTHIFCRCLALQGFDPSASDWQVQWKSGFRLRSPFHSINNCKLGVSKGWFILEILLSYLNGFRSSTITEWPDMQKGSQPKVFWTCWCSCVWYILIYWLLVFLRVRIFHFLGQHDLYIFLLRIRMNNNQVIVVYTFL